MNRTLLPLLLLFSLYWNNVHGGNPTSSLIFTARLNGDSEVPAVTTDGQGIAIFTFDEKKTTLYVNVSLSNLSGAITGMHIHDGVAGVNGPVVINLVPFLNGNRAKGVVHDISRDMMAKFITGGFYINVHTELNPGGEIRGQIGLETDLRYHAVLDGSNEVPEVTTNGTGLFIANLSLSNNQATLNMVFEGLTSPIVGAHIHEGAVGTNGGVIFDLSSFIVGNTLIGDWDATGFLDQLAAGDLYVNVHTIDNPNGEIRGQLVLREGLNFDAVINGSQENPPVDTRGTGLAAVTIKPDLSEVEYYVVFDSLSGIPTGAHFHDGTVGKNGGVVIDLSSTISGNVINGIAPITIDLVNKLLEGGLYINIHTSANPGGEIRGQVYKLAREPYTFDLNGGQENPPSNTVATGAGMASMDRDETNVHFLIGYSGLQGTFTASHFHHAKPGVAGPVIFNLTTFYNAFGVAEGYWDVNSSAPLDSAAVSYFDRGEVYANIHSSDFPGGEIRGNLVHSSLLFSNEPFDPHFKDDLMLSASMNGDEENPPVATDGHGLATIYFNGDRTSATVNVTVDGLSGPIVSAHIHDGAAGANGPVIFPLTYVGNRIQTEITGITPAQLAKFIDGGYYINVHTEENPGGEIRGQIFTEQDITFVANLDGAQEVPAVTTSAKGLGAFHYTIGQTTLDVNVQLTNLSSEITGAHLHTGAVGASGPVIIDLGSLVTGNRIQGSVTLTIPDIIQLANGLVYVNVHTTDHVDGEIRGQLSYQNGLTFDGWVSGLQEVPFANSPASGLAVATVSSDLANVNVWMVTDAVSGTIGASHFHRGAVGTNGPVVLNFASGLSDNAVDFSGPIDPDIVSSLLKGEIYINGHTPAYPGGELRGQMFRLARDGYGFDLCPSQEVGTINAPLAQGSGLLSIDRLHSNVNLAVTTTGLTGPITVSHFHLAPIGVNGGVVVDLTPLYTNGAFDVYGIGVDTALVNAIRDSNIYVNVHTSMHPGGEIRGQIVKDNLCSIETDIEPIDEIVGEVKLSPVPVSDFLNVSLELEKRATLSMNIFDLSGKLLTTDQFQLTEGKNEVRMETESLYPGFYLLMITDGNATQAYKFVK